MTGGDAFFWNGQGQSNLGKFFGQSATMESEVNKDPVTIPGGLKSFATNTLPWYFLNRHLRQSFNGDTAWFSGDVMITYPEKRVIRQNEHLLQDGNDVFILPYGKTIPR